MLGRPLRRRLVLASLVVLTAGAPLAAPGAAITVRQAWIRPAAQGMTAAGYLTIVNHGARADRLVGVASPAAARVSVHQSRQVGAVMTMRAVPVLAIPPRGAVELAPGGYHLMFVGVTAPLRLGDKVPVVLSFQRAGPVRVRLAVTSAAPAMAGMRM